MTVGAGIGCGLVVYGRVVSGAHGVAGETGHLSLDPHGPRCHCGNRGCVEAITSDRAILRSVRTATDQRVTDAADALALALAHKGDPAVRGVCARADEEIGQAIGFLVNILGPERVIISGEGLAAYGLVPEGIRDAFAASAFGTAAAQCDLTTRPLPFEEWARGATATAIQSLMGSGAWEE